MDQGACCDDGEERMFQYRNTFDQLMGRGDFRRISVAWASPLLASVQQAARLGVKLHQVKSVAAHLWPQSLHCRLSCLQSQESKRVNNLSRPLRRCSHRRRKSRIPRQVVAGKRGYKRVYFCKILFFALFCISNSFF